MGGDLAPSDLPEKATTPNPLATHFAVQLSFLTILPLALAPPNPSLASTFPTGPALDVPPVLDAEAWPSARLLSAAECCTGVWSDEWRVRGCVGVLYITEFR